MTAAVLLVVNRTGATSRCIATAHDLLGLLGDLRNAKAGDEGMYNALVLKAQSLAALLGATHHYASWDAGAGGVVYDPRFLLFEFTTNFVLRAPQASPPPFKGPARLQSHSDAPALRPSEAPDCGRKVFSVLLPARGRNRAEGLPD